MKRLPPAVYQTPEEIDARVAELVAEADATPDEPSRQAILQQIAQLRMYADAKRWIESPGLKAVARHDRPPSR